MKRKPRRRLLAFFSVVLLSAGLVCAGLAYYALTELPAPTLPAQFNIKSGSSLRGAAGQLAGAGILRHPELFVLLGRLMGEAGNLKAGIYELDRPVTPLDLLRKITRGDYSLAGITFVEGWTFSQMRKALDEHEAFKHETAGLADADILRRLGIEGATPEGWFFPDTYFFSNGVSDLVVLRRAHTLMKSHLAAQWEKRAPDLPLASPYEALILASIIEKETGRADERALIAAVFINRLRIGMKLQTDPSVIYGMGKAFDGNLRRNDLVADGLYNTYTRPGLPPTPIAMPGLASLTAALNPARSDVLYFVAKGDGSHQFSRSLGEHERAVTKYQRSGRR
ncbi:MAG TPA: endolytic transglycosylase MltG [Burkholderiales bacterium]|nr:endolytic transglycosylase MltG [Burkholderiales bacterium]